MPRKSRDPGLRSHSLEAVQIEVDNHATGQIGIHLLAHASFKTFSYSSRVRSLGGTANLQPTRRKSGRKSFIICIPPASAPTVMAFRPDSASSIYGTLRPATATKQQQQKVRAYAAEVTTTFIPDMHSAPALVGLWIFPLAHIRHSGRCGCGIPRPQACPRGDACALAALLFSAGVGRHLSGVGHACMHACRHRFLPIGTDATMM